MVLPSTRSLEAFVATVRYGSLAAAAPIIGLSVPALSRRLTELERQVGARLLERLPRGVALTDAGSKYLPRAIAVLEQLASASTDLHRDEAIVRVTTIPALATRWLIPRLPAFAARYPGIRVDVRTSLAYERLDADVHDLAIRLAVDREMDVPPLLAIYLAPVWSSAYPDLIEQPADLLKRPLIGPEHRPEFWVEWLHSAGLEAAAGRVRQVDPLLLYELTTRAPVIAIGIEPLVSPLVAEKKLLSLKTVRVRSRRSFFLVDHEIANRPSVRTFKSWLWGEAQRV